MRVSAQGALRLKLRLTYVGPRPRRVPGRDRRVGRRAPARRPLGGAHARPERRSERLDRGRAAGAPGGPSAPTPARLVVTYARVDTPESSDPRGAGAATPSGCGSCPTRSRSAFGRSPRQATVTQPLVEPDATVDATMPAVAGLVEYDAGQWRLRNLTSRPAHRTHLRAAGFVLDLGAGPGVAIRHRMTFASVIGRSVDADDRPVVSEHRFLLLRAGGRTPAPPSPVAPRGRVGVDEDPDQGPARSRPDGPAAHAADGRVRLPGAAGPGLAAGRPGPDGAAAAGPGGERRRPERPHR